MKKVCAALRMKILRKGFVALLATLFLLAAFARLSAQAPNQAFQKGEAHVVPGCGVSGCYAPYDICVNVPAGSTPIAIAHYYDSFSGWGEFINQRQTPTGFCATYMQHSHNVTRIVSFDVLYELPKGPQGVVLSPTEAELLKRLRTGEGLNLSGAAQNTLSGTFLQAAISQLKDSEAVKRNGLEVIDAEFSDDVSISKAIPFSLHLINCRFLKDFVVQDARFDGSLNIEDSIFERAFQFQSVAIKEDLIVKIKPSASSTTLPFRIFDTHVDGRTAITTLISGSVDNLKTGDLRVLAGTAIDVLSFKHLDVNSFRVAGVLTPTKVNELYSTNSKISNSFQVDAIEINNFRADWTTVGELILSNTAIQKGLNLSFSTINSFEWAMGPNGTFPSKGNDDVTGNDLTGVVFKNIKITHADAKESSATNTASSQVPSASVQATQLTSGDSEKAQSAEKTPIKSKSSEVADPALEMLQHSLYSASAYDALEKLLASRGDPQADDVFLAGREARRKSEIRDKPILGRFAWVLDVFQEYVLGYGRFAKWPILWSAIVIVLGFGVFRNENKMERKPEADSKYSKFWYSFELFVPVIDVGVASEWQPKPEHKIIANYARLHKLAGWILVPVILAALTGFAK